MVVAADKFESMVDSIYDLFSNEETAQQYGNDPNGWVEENLPEGVEPGDVATCMPEVATRMGGDFESNMGRYNATCGVQETSITSTVVNECSYTYNTCHGGGYFAECPPNVTVINIHITVVEVNWEEPWDCNYPPGWDDYPPHDPPETIDDYVVTDEGADGPPITTFDDDYPADQGEGDGEEPPTDGPELPTDDYPADDGEPQLPTDDYPADDGGELPTDDYPADDGGPELPTDDYQAPDLEPVEPTYPGGNGPPAEPEPPAPEPEYEAPAPEPEPAYEPPPEPEPAYEPPPEPPPAPEPPPEDVPDI